MAARQVVDAAQASGARAVAIQADVTLEDDVARLFATAHETLGRIDGLVNNAGATLHIGDLADTPVATFERSSTAIFSARFSVHAGLRR